jgi:ABC-type antimicrobial peptide transport system permease subunit
LLANGDNPIGRRIQLAGAEREIVGVVGNVRITQAGFSVPGMSSAPLKSSPLVYLPAAQTPDSLTAVHIWFSPMWTVRARDMSLAESALREAINSADPLLPVGSVRRMSEIRAEATAQQRLLMILVGVIAAAALALSAVGIYGLIAHAVGERRREFGMRMALGATAAQTVRSLALSGIALASIGAGAGIGLAWMAARVLDSQSIIWGIGSRDPVTFVGVAVFLLAVATIASVVPALRVLRLDPARALRD